MSDDSSLPGTESDIIAAPIFAEIAFALPLDQTFTYAVPDVLRDRVAVGMRAVAPFQTRIETGYIVSLSDSTQLERVRALLDLPDNEPVFGNDMLALCRWIAEYYCCSLGEALATAAPAGLRGSTRKIYTLRQDQVTQSGRFNARQQKVVAELFKRGPLSEGQIAQAVGRTALSNTLQSLVERGMLTAEAVFSDGSVSLHTEMWVSLIEDAIPPMEDLARAQRRAPKRAALYLDLLYGEPERLCSALCAKHNASPSVLVGLEKEGWVRRYEREAYRSPDLSADARATMKLALNAEQKAAYDAAVSCMTRREFQTFLLHGITGSGKTEVYLQVIEEALNLGRDAILLVPEISLTPQTVGRLVARFAERIAVLHSGLGSGERYDEWRRARRGEVRIVVGARSAVFAPLPDLGLIIVDEEHDTSYKQGDTPRYHARDVAIVRAKMNNAVCILGSATPSLESYYNSATGKSVRIELRHRATRAVLPDVQVVDMREERRESAGDVILSRVLEEEAQERIRLGEQVILLLNRRGHSPYVLCPKCGWVYRCENCNVSMTYHARNSSVYCHYCNDRKDAPIHCVECGFGPVVYLGTGTQKAEEYLMQAFPGARVERMDADSTSEKGGHAKILGRFAAGETDILIGTQMLAKGHDYPGVTLVGVINADTGLSVPDFRSAENAFQLLTQVAGRAGRGGRPGKVIIQTFRPRHYVIQTAAKQDYLAFYHREMQERDAAKYPPYRRMANLALEGEDPLVVEQSMVALARTVFETIRTLGFEGVETLGPAPASISRVMKKYRWNLALLSKSAKRLNTLVRAVRERFEKEVSGNKVALKADLDPFGMC